MGIIIASVQHFRKTVVKYCTKLECLTTSKELRVNVESSWPCHDRRVSYATKWVNLYHKTPVGGRGGGGVPVSAKNAPRWNTVHRMDLYSVLRETIPTWHFHQPVTCFYDIEDTSVLVPTSYCCIVS